jgi:hypothetical protein
MKRPSFQFYPSDWLRDTALRSCSTGARGLWIDMICFMHEGNPYGYLKVGDKVIHPSNLARMVGEPLEVVEGWLTELQEANVFDVDDGAICSRRMIRDEKLRQKRAEGGKLGGNPALKVIHKVNHKVNLEVKQKPTPSSSSSSSSSSSNKKTKEQAMRPDFVDQQLWDDWLIIRNKKGAPLTISAWKLLCNEAAKAGYSIEDAIKECCLRNWASFKSKWVAENQTESERAREHMAQLTRGMATPKPKNFWEKTIDETNEVIHVETKRLL